MRMKDLFAAGSLASPQHRKVRSRGDLPEIAVLLLRLASVGLLTSVGWLHLHLWQIGYRHIPSIGPLFLVTTVSALVIAAGMLIRPSRLLGLLGVGVLVGILLGLIVSVNVGLFGFTDSLSAPFAVESIVLEAVGAVVLVAWTGLDLFQESRGSRRLPPVSRASDDIQGGVITTFISRPHANSLT